MNEAEYLRVLDLVTRLANALQVYTDADEHRASEAALQALSDARALTMPVSGHADPIFDATSGERRIRCACGWNASLEREDGVTAYQLHCAESQPAQRSVVMEADFYGRPLTPEQRQRGYVKG